MSDNLNNFILELVNLIDESQLSPSNPDIFQNKKISKKYKTIKEIIDKKISLIVSKEIDPFSENYINEQLLFYTMISGRKYTPAKYELSNHDNPLKNLHCANPYGLKNSNFLSDYLLNCSIVLKLLGQEKPKILDLGCGTGTTSEIFAFTGASVVSVDIDPNLGNLSKERAKIRNLDIARITCGYDDLNNPSIKQEILKNHNLFDFAFFEASFHHSLKNKELLEVLLNNYLTSDGIIAFVNEPIFDLWGENGWGVRNDCESIYVASKYGWLETGYSFGYLKNLSSRIGCHCEFIRKDLNSPPIFFFSKNYEIIRKILENANYKNLNSEEQIKQNSKKSQETIVFCQSLNKRVIESEGEVQKLKEKIISREKELEDKNSKIIKYGSVVKMLNEKKLSREKELKDKNSKIIKSESEVRMLNLKIISCEKELEDKTSKIIKSEREVQMLNEKITSFEIQIKDILNSTSWKISKPARFVFKKLNYLLNSKNYKS